MWLLNASTLIPFLQSLQVNPMLRPDTIGNIGHLPVCYNEIINSLPQLENWKPVATTFNSVAVPNTEFAPGVNSFALLTDGAAPTMAGVKQFAYHMPIYHVPDDTRPGYPFLLALKGQIHLEMVATKAPCDCAPFVGFANTGSPSGNVYWASCVPVHFSISDADTIFIDGVIDQTFTVALPPAHEHDQGFHLCVGFLFRTRSGDVQFRVIDNNLSAHVLYQNRPCYDPSIS